MSVDMLQTALSCLLKHQRIDPAFPWIFTLFLGLSPLFHFDPYWPCQCGVQLRICRGFRNMATSIPEVADSCWIVCMPVTFYPPLIDDKGDCLAALFFHAHSTFKVITVMTWATQLIVQQQLKMISTELLCRNKNTAKTACLKRPVTTLKWTIWSIQLKLKKERKKESLFEFDGFKWREEKWRWKSWWFEPYYVCAGKPITVSVFGSFGWYVRW